MDRMFFFRLTINQNVVEVYGIELIEVLVESVINKPLERSRSAY
jgi:hypothetical protein